jgi:uncharacterized Fe-S cluster-containing radical SAM superfamily protein
MNLAQPYNTGVMEIFSNFGKDPCLDKDCRYMCPVGFTCMRAQPPRSGELRLDLSGCNLMCPFCWTINKPHFWTPVDICDHITCRLDNYYRSNIHMSIVYIRVTGGEPILNRKRIYHLMELLRLLDENVSKTPSYSQWKQRKSPKNIWGRRNIKIQTNGLELPDVLDLIITDLKEIQNICITFEVSLKGTNPDEFSILSGRRKGFSKQILALEQLIEYEKKGYPIFARAILGILHSQQYDLVFPTNKKRMMLNLGKDFVDILKQLMTMPDQQHRVYVEPLRFTEQMEKAETKCNKIGILAEPKLGFRLEPGKKIKLTKTYLAEIIRVAN